MAYYLKAIALGDYYLAYENIARTLVNRAKYKEAEDFIKNRALPKFPENKTFYYLLTASYCGQNNIAEAEKLRDIALIAYIDRDPSSKDKSICDILLKNAQ